MDQEHIELLREEALRLLDVVIDMLQRMKDAPGVVVDEVDNEHPTFTPKSLEEQLRMLADEQSKLQRLEMVLAVVGTMKAGKSTTINAIVGAEVLPNRNRPMTALPTRIRHLPGQQSPTLTVDKAKLLNQVMAELKSALTTPQGREFIEEMPFGKDMSELIAKVQASQTVQQRYEGPEQIYEFLRDLNDLVRMCFALDVKFPFDAYRDIDNIPLIEIEFAHFADLPPGAGSFTLLDTPGPNEAGQQHLRHMLRDQLRRASAVMAVLDYTQLGSDASDQIRYELAELNEVAQGRMYALVNKIDEKNRNSDSLDETCNQVAAMLKPFERSNVFPVASKLGDLSNRALRALDESGALPLPTGAEDDWVMDFANLAFGASWEAEDLQDHDDVRKRAGKLWRNSRFSEPLEKVLLRAHAQAAIFAISSSASKVKDIAKSLNNFLNVREVALGKSVDELTDEIKALESDIHQVITLRSDSRERSNEVFQEIKTSIDQTFLTVREAIGQEVKKGFSAAKHTEQKQVVAEHTSIVGFTFLGLAKKIFGNTDTRAERRRKKKFKFGREFDPQNPIIQLDTERDAKEVIQGIEDGVRDIIKHNERSLHKYVNKELERFKREFDRSVSRQAVQLINALSERFGRQGFSIDIQLPTLPSLSLPLSSQELLADAIEKKQRNVPYRRRSSGVWGTICGWFDSEDWGWESYTTTEGYYQIDINLVANSINHVVNKSFSELKDAVVKLVERPLEAAVDVFFEQLHDLINQLSSDLSQSIRDKQSSQEQQLALAQILVRFKHHVPSLRGDCEALAMDTCVQVQEVA
ncbi:dynamin family protein [Pseudomonas gingeri]|uniref:dynamin family protein n=1 Tax=Pseudomonas gingeri TaxID=117681 RepID=UPI0015A00B8F|nr:dynamin family protein [Pseudomonas gingeri]NWA05400.1 dynamin family protein [Pseudomonas gingeri]NWA17823.1 dynamin family protein [Pseudomonas gingeri]NWA57787.1 dynamin family protein [Pseudomonas gingeri]NWA98808.1 dynamin family protein [Pseudomonas gingeri]NWB05934.1 dynamin family protein [Pseudomonas gingeri]